MSSNVEDITKLTKTRRTKKSTLTDSSALAPEVLNEVLSHLALFDDNITLTRAALKLCDEPIDLSAEDLTRIKVQFAAQVKEHKQDLVGGVSPLLNKNYRIKQWDRVYRMH